MLPESRTFGNANSRGMRVLPGQQIATVTR